MNVDSDLIIQVIHETIIKIKSEDNLSHINSGDKFESYVTDIITNIAASYGISVEQTGAQTFPDIILNGTYGIEVKYTKTLKWESTGNSIFEGTLKKEVTDDIYLLFGRKNGNKIEVRCKYYDECLSDIKVTHSPRFMINMDAESTVFDSLGVPYHEYKKLEKKKQTEYAKRYFRQNLRKGEEVWFLDEENEAVRPTITEYRSLPVIKRNQILIESIVLFPEIFSSSSTKYTRLAIYLLQEYQVVCSSLRDIFSATGRVKIMIEGEVYNLSQIYNKLYVKAEDIKELLLSIEADKLKKYWSRLVDVSDLQPNNVIDFWLNLIDKYSSIKKPYFSVSNKFRNKNIESKDFIASVVFMAGLEKKK